MAFTKEQKTKIIKSFKISDKDTGSSEVQIALLTERINNVAKHITTNKKDNASKYGLMKMVNNRKSHLAYLKRSNPESYQAILKKLGLRK